MAKNTPLRAIREKCRDCCVGDLTEIRLCEIVDCALHPFRFGSNPSRKGIGGSTAKLADHLSEEGIVDLPPEFDEEPPTQREKIRQKTYADRSPRKEVANGR